MSTPKFKDINRRTHAAKRLADSAREKSHSESFSEDEKTQFLAKGSDELKEQFEIIREDVLQLREDLAVGYDLAKQWLGSNANLKQLLNFRGLVGFIYESKSKA